MASITLLGDSVLDNFYWLGNKKADLTYELTQKGYEVHNLAVDESRLDDLINGIVPRDIYVNSRSYPYITKGIKVYALELLEKVNTNAIVLSVGGNDMRGNIMTLFFGVDAFINRTFTPEFSTKYVNLLTQLTTKASKVILVVVYIPYLGAGSPYALVNGMHDAIYSKIRNIYYGWGKQFNIPVLDLSLTFDPFNRTHYGSTEIEPSNFSNSKIAEMIDYIMQNYSGHKIYYAPQCGAITVKDN